MNMHESPAKGKGEDRSQDDRILVIDTTIDEEPAAERTSGPSLLATVGTWIARLWWPALLVTVLAMSVRYVDDGDPTWRFRSWRDVLGFALIIAALTLEVRPACIALVRWCVRRGAR